MFATLKKWFGKREDQRKEVAHPALTLRGAAVNAIRAEVPVFRGPKSISEELISRVAKEIKLEGLESLGSTSSENSNEKGLSHF